MKNTIKYRIIKDWKHLDRSLYTFDEKTRTFSSKENWIIVDFTWRYWITFDVDDYCVIRCGDNCIVRCGSSCFIDVGSFCSVSANNHCTFLAGNNCTFSTGRYWIIRRKDVYEIIEAPINTEIKLNAHLIKWFTIVEKKEKIKIKTEDWQTISIDREKAEKLWFII